MRVRRLLITSVVVFSVALPASAATSVAVFNFQMKSDTPEWVSRHVVATCYQLLSNLLFTL